MYAPSPALTRPAAPLNAHALPLDVRWDYQWQDGFMPEVARILRECLLHLIEIQIAPMQADTQQATDLYITVTAVMPLSIAVRLRRAHYTYRDLTLRAHRTSGAKTEVEKIKGGAGQFYVYGWTDGWRIPEWMLVDLNRVRESGLLHRQRRIMSNKDGTTSFIAIPYQELSAAGCVLRSRIGGAR